MYSCFNMTNSSTLTNLGNSDNASHLNDNGSSRVFQRDQNLAQVEIAVQAVIFVLAVLGNGLVLVILLAVRRKKLTRMNTMIVHLSVADLFVAFFNVLPQLLWDVTHRFQGGFVLCKFITYVQVVAMYASSYVLISTAIDRYFAICHPLTTHAWTTRKMHVLVGIAWLISLVFAIPQFVIFSYKEITPGSGVYDCAGAFYPEWTIQVYVTWVTVAIYIVPFMLLTFAYGRICYVVWGSMKGKESFNMKSTSYQHCQVEESQNGILLTENGGNDNNKPRLHVTSRPRAHVRGLSKAKFKTVKLTMAVIVCYLLCWGPFFISQMWAVWDSNAPFEASSFVILMLLASLNSCTNPWIYLAFSSDSFLHRLWRSCCVTDVRVTSRSFTFDSDTKPRSTVMTSYVGELSQTGHASCSGQLRTDN